MPELVGTSTVNPAQQAAGSWGTEKREWSGPFFFFLSYTGKLPQPHLFFFQYSSSLSLSHSPLTPLYAFVSFYCTVCWIVRLSGCHGKHHHHFHLQLQVHLYPTYLLHTAVFVPLHSPLRLTADGSWLMLFLFAVILLDPLSCTIDSSPPISPLLNLPDDADSEGLSDSLSPPPSIVCTFTSTTPLSASSISSLSSSASI